MDSGSRTHKNHHASVFSESGQIIITVLVGFILKIMTYKNIKVTNIYVQQILLGSDPMTINSLGSKFC